MKRVISFLLCILMLAALVGCGAKTKGIPTLDEVEHMRDDSALSEAFHGLTKEQLHAAWGEPERSDETYPLDVWTFEDSDLELIMIYDSDNVITKWYFGIE